MKIAKNVTLIKNQIKVIVRIKGSHLGIIKHLIEKNNPSVNFEDYKDFANQLIKNKFGKVETKLREGIRYQ